MRFLVSFAVFSLAAVSVFGIPTRAGAQGQAQMFSLPKVGTLPTPTMMHGCAVVGKRLYIIAGNFDPSAAGRPEPGGWTADVWSAEISSQMQLANWRKEQPLPERRAYITNAVQVVNDRIYVVGGSTAAEQNSTEDQTVITQDVVWTTVGADGVLAPWKRSQPFPGRSISCTSTCATDRSLLVLGGHSMQEVSDVVLAAHFAPDGSLGNWREVAKLPTPLWFHGSAILEDRIYVWGGLTTQKASDTSDKVYSAQLAPDGRIGAWEPETPMPYGGVYSSAFSGSTTT